MKVKYSQVDNVRITNKCTESFSDHVAFLELKLLQLLKHLLQDHDINDDHDK